MHTPNKLYDELYDWASNFYTSNLVTVYKKDENIEYKEIYQFTTVEYATLFVNAIKDDPAYKQMEAVQDNVNVHIFFVEKRAIITEENIENYALKQIQTRLEEAITERDKTSSEFDKTYQTGIIHALEISIALLDAESKLKMALKEKLELRKLSQS